MLTFQTLHHSHSNHNDIVLDSSSRQKSYQLTCYWANQWCFPGNRCHFQCTSIVSDSGNLDSRLEDALSISKQSFKELSEGVRPTYNSVPGQKSARSMSPTISWAIILLSAENYWQTEAKYWATDPGAEGTEWEEQTAKDESIILVMTKWGKGFCRTDLRQHAQGHALPDFTA